jgi:F5/8 type C domain
VVAHAIATYEATSTRPVTEVLEWPLTADRPCKDISVSAPYRADAYISALSGGPPPTTLGAHVDPAKDVTLTTPYGNAVTALEDGTYTVSVTDASTAANFHLIGPGIDRRTSRRFEGMKTWPISLRAGMYRYGADRSHEKLGHRFEVLATQKPGVNIALGKHATASSEAQFRASYAVDGLAETFWGAGDFPPQWIEIDLGAAYSIVRIRLITAQLPAGFTEHRVWVRGPSPGDKELLLHEFAGETNDSQALEYSPAKPVTGVRYIRVETVTSPSWVAWREIEIFGG